MDDRDGTTQPDRWPRPLAAVDGRKGAATVLGRGDGPTSYWARGVPAEPMEPMTGPMLALANSCVLELDHRGYVTACSAGSSQRVTGYAQDDLVGRHLSVLYDSEAVANLQPQRDLSAALASSGISEKTWRVRSDGARFWATVVLAPRYGVQGEVVGFTAMMHDDSADASRSRRTSVIGVPVGDHPDHSDHFDRPADVEALHGDVINRLFRVGLTLCGARSLATQPEILAHLDEAVEGLDETIRFIRRRLWQLDQDPSTPNANLRAATSPASAVPDRHQSPISL